MYFASEAASGAHDQDTSGAHGKMLGVPSPVSRSCQLAELLQQGCGDRFLTVVGDETNVDCGRRVLSLSARRSASKANA